MMRNLLQKFGVMIFALMLMAAFSTPADAGGKRDGGSSLLLTAATYSNPDWVDMYGPYYKIEFTAEGKVEGRDLAVRFWDSDGNKQTNRLYWSGKGKDRKGSYVTRCRADQAWGVVIVIENGADTGENEIVSNTVTVNRP